MLKTPKKNKNHLIIEPERAVIVKRIFNMFDNGISMAKIASKLMAEKIYCPGYYDYGGSRSGDNYKWRADNIKRILKSQVYIGNTEYGKKINLSYKSKKVKNIPREDWQVALNTHEAIIDKETFEEVQRMLKDKFYKPKRRYEYLLKELVYCGHCGARMQYKNRLRTKVHSKKLEVPDSCWYYKCRMIYKFPSICDRGHTISERDLNEIVIWKLVKLVHK